jgi:hypothetical protein
MIRENYRDEKDHDDYARCWTNDDIGAIRQTKGTAVKRGENKKAIKYQYTNKNILLLLLFIIYSLLLLLFIILLLFEMCFCETFPLIVTMTQPQLRGLPRCALTLKCHFLDASEKQHCLMNDPD